MCNRGCVFDVPMVWIADLATGTCIRAGLSDADDVIDDTSAVEIDGS
jgi:hypothetical protein